jgi:hypothetical protein
MSSRPATRPALTRPKWGSGSSLNSSVSATTALSKGSAVSRASRQTAQTTLTARTTKSDASRAATLTFKGSKTAAGGRSKSRGGPPPAAGTAAAAAAAAAAQQVAQQKQAQLRGKKIRQKLGGKLLELTNVKAANLQLLSPHAPDPRLVRPPRTEPVPYGVSFVYRPPNNCPVHTR